MFMSSAIIH